MRLPKSLALALLLIGLGLSISGCGLPPHPTEPLPDLGELETVTQVVSWRGAEASADVAKVAPGFFSDKGLSVALGRTFIESDPDASAVIISHELWQDIASGDPAVVGSDLVVEGESAVIVGVLSEGMSGEVGVFRAEAR